MLLKFAIGDQGMSIVNGRPVAADIHYQGLANRLRAGADSVSKVTVLSYKIQLGYQSSVHSATLVHCTPT